MDTVPEEVFVADDGWLFLMGGTNRPAELFSMSSRDRKALTRDWSGLLRDRRERANEFGARYLHLFVPDKINTYRERLGARGRRFQFPAEAIETQAEALGLEDVLVPLSAYFRKQAQTIPMFYRTDTHWTVEGCFSAYQMLCWKLGAPQKAELVTRERTLIRDAVLDLGGKLSPSVAEDVEYGRFGKGVDRVHANDIVRLREDGVLKNDVGLHVGSMVSFRCSAPLSPLRVLVFGDSFCEYRKHQLTGMLAETVAELTFVWSAGVDWGIVDEMRPDVVVTEIAERFVGRVPTDGVDLRAHAKAKVDGALARLA